MNTLKTEICAGLKSTFTRAINSVIDWNVILAISFGRFSFILAKRLILIELKAARSQFRLGRKITYTHTFLWRRKERKKQKKKTFRFWWISTVFIPFNNFYFLHLYTVYAIFSFALFSLSTKHLKSVSVFDVYRCEHICRRYMTSSAHTPRAPLFTYKCSLNRRFDFRKYCSLI